MRLEQLGFADVYDYVPGKNDWLAAGLPREGESASVPFAGDLADKDVPICNLNETLTEALSRLEADQQEACAVVDGDGVVLGMLVRRRGGPGRRQTVADAMRPGPTTIRAHEQLAPLLERMRQSHTEALLVTNAEGRLLGLLRRDAAEREIEGMA